MKIIKSMKKLKFWSRKKRKKLLLTEAQSPPPPRQPPPPPPPQRPPPPLPPPYYEPLLPSAPPLPPWVEYDEQSEEMLWTTSEADSTSEKLDNSTSRTHFSPVSEICPQEVEAHNSYQQYMVLNPVYDTTPVVPELKKLERGRGAFGCVVGFGVHLVRCVFPCFHIREEAVLLKN